MRRKPRQTLTEIWRPLTTSWAPGLVAGIHRMDVPMLLHHLRRAIGYDGLTGEMWYMDAPGFGPELVRGWPVIWLGDRALRAQDVAWMLWWNARAPSYVSPLVGFPRNEMRYRYLASTGTRTRASAVDMEAINELDATRRGPLLPDLF